MALTHTEFAEWAGCTVEEAATLAAQFVAGHRRTLPGVYLTTAPDGLVRFVVQDETEFRAWDATRRLRNSLIRPDVTLPTRS